MRKLAVLLAVFASGFALSEYLHDPVESAHAVTCPEPAPPLPIAGDVDGDRRLNINDPIYLLNHLFVGGPAPVEPRPGPVTTVILTRHAEREPGGAEAVLAPAGRVRAEMLGQILESLDPCQIITSDQIRTQQTVQPWIDRLEDPPEMIQTLTPALNPDADPPIDPVAEGVAAIRAIPVGATAVMCHHSWTIPGILTELGMPDAALLGRVHDSLLILLFPQGGEPQWIHMSYADLPPVPADGD